jgi:outer membrane protein OmpA-like peptidoglycan-associated protein
MMMAMRRELQAINARLDNQPARADNAPTVIKVQQIPLEPQQKIMEEVFEVRFDFNKSNIKPEYEQLIRDLVSATSANKNVRVSVVGHTDTMGSDSYNFALGGRRAVAVRNMLIQYGIPASQITAVSAGEKDLKVPTGDQVKKAENRRVQIMKETTALVAPSAAAGPVKVTIKKPDPLPETNDGAGEYVNIPVRPAGDLFIPADTATGEPVILK